MMCSCGRAANHDGPCATGRANVDYATRRDTAILVSMTIGNLEDAAVLFRHMAEACEAGIKHARECGASADNRRDAVEVWQRARALTDFVDGGPAYTDWLASLEGK